MSMFGWKISTYIAKGIVNRQDNQKILDLLCATSYTESHQDETCSLVKQTRSYTMTTYYISMIDNITNEVFIVVVSATSLHEALRQAFIDWWQSASLVR